MRTTRAAPLPAGALVVRRARPRIRGHLCNLDPSATFAELYGDTPSIAPDQGGRLFSSIWSEPPLRLIGLDNSEVLAALGLDLRIPPRWNTRPRWPWGRALHELVSAGRRHSLPGPPRDHNAELLPLPRPLRPGPRLRHRRSARRSARPWAPRRRRRQPGAATLRRARPRDAARATSRPRQTASKRSPKLDRTSLCAMGVSRRSRLFESLDLADSDLNGTYFKQSAWTSALAVPPELLVI